MRTIRSSQGIEFALFWAVAAILLLAPTLSAQTPPPPPIMLGTAWYPEQWPESRWDADLTLMQQAGIHMVRVGEFAWSRMEPSEGQYDLDWLDHAVAAAAKHGIYTVVGTPTAAPPAWLTQKYPETLRVDEEGHRAEHGNRQQFNFANAKYRELARKIAEQLAKRFGHNPYVLGWQIDNEYSDISFDPDTKAQFQQWLKARYVTLDNLNARWTTSYWSETIFDWSQIPIQTQYGNPGLLLAWKRFVSDTWRSYQKNQLEVIRANSDPRQFITTNTMGWFDGFDHYVVEKDLDLAAWDDYVGQGHLDPAKNGFAHDLTRGFKGKNFWVMETQPGSVNWAPVNNSLDKGEVRAMAWHAVGHGADVVSYWQWRSALNGQEEYHGTLRGSGRNTRALICGSAADWPGVCQGGSGAGGNVGQIRSCDAALLRQPLGHRLAASQQELRSSGGISQLLRAAARGVSVHRRGRTGCAAQPIQTGCGARTERALRCSGEKSYRLCARGRAPGAGPALGHER